jgi:hypothetical protein
MKKIPFIRCEAKIKSAPPEKLGALDALTIPALLDRPGAS